MSILEDHLGSSNNLKVLALFMDKPAVSYTLVDVQNALPISRRQVIKWVHFYWERGYLCRTGYRTGWQLNEDHPMVETIFKTMQLLSGADHHMRSGST